MKSIWLCFVEVMIIVFYAQYYINDRNIDPKIPFNQHIKEYL